MSEHVTGSESQARAEARRERLRKLMDRLERELAQPAGQDLAVWRANVALVCDELDGVLQDHIRETEQELFVELQRTAPHVGPRIERLRDEHPNLVDELAALRESLLSTDDPEQAVATTRDRGLSLLNDLLRHRHAGADLLYEAYWVDVATAD